ELALACGWVEPWELDYSEPNTGRCWGIWRNEFGSGPELLDAGTGERGLTVPRFLALVDARDERRGAELRELARAMSVAVNEPKKIDSQVGRSRRRESHPRAAEGWSNRRWWDADG
ncbi:hypothetical protein, partial [Bradyrhizobium sp. NBAIM08]|uniref:hypothetical protein n=1 Tax=Bradyrhizobium sp. NBAIM08 TaxID=2793815 RepID=UPI001CD5B67F